MVTAKRAGTAVSGGKLWHITDKGVLIGTVDSTLGLFMAHPIGAEVRAHESLQEATADVARRYTRGRPVSRKNGTRPRGKIRGNIVSGSSRWDTPISLDISPIATEHRIDNDASFTTWVEPEDRPALGDFLKRMEAFVQAAAPESLRQILKAMGEPEPVQDNASNLRSAAAYAFTSRAVREQRHSQAKKNPRRVSQKAHRAIVGRTVRFTSAVAASTEGPYGVVTTAKHAAELRRYKAAARKAGDMRFQNWTPYTLALFRQILGWRHEAARTSPLAIPVRDYPGVILALKQVAVSAEGNIGVPGISWNRDAGEPWDSLREIQHTFTHSPHLAKVEAGRAVRSRENPSQRWKTLPSIRR